MATAKGSLASQMHRTSTMRNILTDYGFYGSKGDPPAKVKKLERRPSTTSAKKKKTFQFLDDGYIFEDAKDVVERKKEKDKRVLEMLNDMQRLRYYYYLEYKERLVDKVEKQRSQLQKQKELEEKRRLAKEARQAQLAHRCKKRLERIPLKHDDDFLKGIPKTDFYCLVQEEHSLKKKGELKSHADLEQFWSAHLDPEAALSSASFRQPATRISPPPDNESRDQATELRHVSVSQANALDKISEENSRPSTKKVDNRTGKQYQKYLETLFPRTELPRLHIFEMDLSEKVDEDEERRFREWNLRERRRQDQKQLRNRMFHLALTHEATAKRIIEDRLDETSQMIFQREYTNLGDLVSRAVLKAPEKPAPVAVGPPERLDNVTERDSEDAESPREEKEETEKVEGYEEQEEDEKEEDNEELEPVDSRPTSVKKKQPIALSMRELESSLPLMKAQGISCMWRNYTKFDSVPLPDVLISPRTASRASGEVLKEETEAEERLPSR